VHVTETIVARARDVLPTLGDPLSIPEVTADTGRTATSFASSPDAFFATRSTVRRDVLFSRSASMFTRAPTGSPSMASR